MKQVNFRLYCIYKKNILKYTHFAFKVNLTCFSFTLVMFCSVPLQGSAAPSIGERQILRPPSHIASQKRTFYLQHYWNNYTFRFNSIFLIKIVTINLGLHILLFMIVMVCLRTLIREHTCSQTI